MKKILSAIVAGTLLLGHLSTDLSAQTDAIIGAGSNIATTSNSVTSDAGPIYCTGSGSSFVYSMHHMVYTAAELATAGIQPGMLITKIAWNKANNAAYSSSAASVFDIYLKNSFATGVPAAPATYATLISGATQAYGSTTQTFPATTGWVDFNLTAPFLYTGGALELTTNWDISAGGSTASGATDNFAWAKDAGNILAYAGSSLSSTLPNLRTVRAQIRFTYVPGGPCTSPPTPGAAQTSASSICNGQSINLSLTGNSSGTGQTYQWKSGSTATGPWTNIGTPQSSPTLTNITPPGGATTYYIADVTCGTSTATSTVDSVVVPLAFAGGSYTIDPSLPSSSTNFQTLTAAVNAISCGISGAVVFNMAAGNTFNEQVTLPETIGTTATNTVTFNGNGDTVNFTGTVSMPWTIGLDGADYIRFNNLVVQGNGTYSLVTHLWNDADNNTFKNCTFIAPENGSSTTQIPFSVSGSATSGTTAGNSGSYNVVDSCTIISGYYNTVFYGTTATPSVGNQVKNSTLLDFYIYGSYNLYQTDLLIKNNTVERPTRTSMSSFYGIYFSTGVSNSIMEQNRIGNQFGGNPTYSGTSYSIYVSSTSASVGNENKIINNVLGNFNGNSSVYGIYMPSAIHTQVYYNTISIDNIAATSGTVYGIYSTGTSGGIDIMNNNISITQGGSGTKYALYFSSSALGKSSNYNNFFIGSTAGTNNIGYLSSAQASFSAWQTAGGGVFDQNSTNVDPMFISAITGDFTPTNAGMNDLGTPIAGITTDFLGNTRSTTTPDMGAYEFSVAACAGTVTAGVATSPSTVCSGIPFLLQATGATAPAGGQSGNWQSASSPTGPWVDIAGAVTPNYTLGAGITAATSFRYWMTCSNNNSTDTSNVVTITLNPANQCYCIPSYTYGCASGDNIDDVILVGDISPGINNLNTPCPTNGYQDYTNLSATLTAGFTYNGNVTTTYSSASENVRIWIDYNSDGIFQSTEEIATIASISNSSTGAYTFTVPITQAAGSYRMRVRLVYGSTPATIDPCNNESYGETHDYTVNIIASTSCSGTPSAGTVPATMAVCSTVPFSIISTGSTLAGNITAQWQSRNPAGTGTWTNITGAAAASYTINAGITTPTDYRYILTCTTSGLSDTTSIIAVTISPASQCYCIPVYTTGCGAGDDIRDVILAGDVAPGINNLNTPCPISGYQDYTNLSATLTAGNTYSGNVTTNYNYADENVRIWIDYNQNGQFEAGETIGLIADIDNYSTGAYTFTVPPTTAPGTYRMRVRLAYYTIPNTIDPCTSETYGEAHDYTIVITGGGGCVYPIVNLGNDTTICDGNTLTLNAGNPGLDYLWSDNSTNQTLDVTTSGTYSVTVTDSTCSTTDSIVVTVNPSPVVDLGGNAAICQGDILTLDAGNQGATFLWNDNSTNQTLDVSAVGTYSVTVTNGGCSASDTVMVSYQGFPTGDSIIAGLTAQPCTFTFSVANGANTTTYNWNFGDGSAPATGANATHQYTANSSYLVTVVISNDCGDSDTLTTTVTCSGVGIGDVALADNALILYPNPTSDRITIENTSNLKMEYITVFNVLGQIVYQNTPQSAQKHQLNVAQLASGLYTVRIKTNEGMMTRKFEILK